MKKIGLLIASLLCMLTASTAFAQNIQATGSVKDANTGEPVSYASVIVKGTTKGVETDDFGNFSLSIPKNGTLVFSSIGYKNLELPINGRISFDVKLEPDAIMLENTVVVGYGSARKISSIVGATTTVKAKVFQSRPVANAGDALQGQVAGLQVFTSSGEPSATVSMRLRGVNSIEASNTPLFILDGAAVSIGIFQSLNSNDIENISVMKDAASTSIYGSRAANGVVYITTKRGSGETPTVQVRGQYGFSTLAHNKTTMMNSEQWFQFREMQDPTLLNNADFQANKKFRLENNIGTNWENYIFNKTAPIWNADMNISGINGRTDYYVSLGALDQKGIEPNSQSTRYTLRSNLNSRMTNWLKIGLNLGLSYQKNKTAGFSTTGNSWYNPVNVVNWSLPWASAYEIKKDSNGNFLGYGDELDYVDDMGMWNHKYLTGIQPSHNTYLRLNGNLYEEISPIKGLIIRSTQSIEGYDYRSKSKTLPVGPFKKDPTSGKTQAKASESFTRYYQLQSTNTIEYKFKIAENHNVIALLGHESILSNSEGFGASSKEQTDLRLMEVNNGLTPNTPTFSFSETAQNSIFTQIEYDYKEKYQFKGSFRRDGSSLFGSNRRYANFYSVGGNWVIKNEDFLKNVSWVNSLKIGINYGTTGNSGISNYLSYGLVSPTTQQYGGNPSWYISNPDNKDLTWETIKNLNININTRLFDFASIDIDIYNKLTTDMLMTIPYSFTTGFASGWGNIGNMRNTGIDVQLSFDVLNKNDFYLNISGNFNYNSNTITKLFGGRDEFVVPNTGIKYKVGMPYGEIYYVRYAGVDPANGKQLWLDKDGNITTTYSEDNAVFTGKQRFAPFAGGIQINFAWKGISLNADFTAVAGKWTINNDKFFIENANFAADHNQTTNILYNSWTTPGQITDIPKYSETRKFDTHLLENASYIRLKNLQISYSLPKSLMKKSGFMRGARVYAIGRNLLTITKYSGYDPEVDSNLQLGNYPNSKQFTFGVELTF